MKKSLSCQKRVLLLSSAIISCATLIGFDVSFAQNASSNDSDKDVVVVKGTRGSIQSSISRKKRADTISDSIVAEDVGKFPDKNVGEALSRITGVQLQRDFGEGVKVSIRGVEPDLNRVEINGSSVVAASNTGSRGAALNDLPSELIQSIDVFKGFTADMVEGGVGGTVSIKTRKPLDFKKPTLAITGSSQYQTTDGRWKPRISVLATDKFLDDRLGLMANIAYDNIVTRNDYARNTYWILSRDFDFSPEKNRESTNPLAAAVTTAAGCSTLTGTDLTDCQTQWYDYSPRVPRYGVWWRDNRRASAEFTADYKLNDESRVWVSYQKVKQKNKLHDRNFVVDFTDVNNRLVSQGAYPTYNATTGVPTGGSCVSPSTTSTPAGVVVSDDHRVTEFVIGDCMSVSGRGARSVFTTEARDFTQVVDTNYVSAGYNFKGDRLTADVLISHVDSSYVDDTNRAYFAMNVPGIKVTIDDDNVPHFTFPSGFDPNNAANYVEAGIQYRPVENNIYENQIKLDFDYDLGSKFFKKLEFGGRWSEYSTKVYNGGGYTADYGSNLTSTADDILVLTANINQTAIYDPLNTTGVIRSPDAQTFTNNNFYTGYVNAAMMAQMVGSSMGRTPGGFFDGYDGVSGLPSGWVTADFAQLSRYFDTSNFNHANVRQALGSDGLLYKQYPAYDSQEETRAAYLKTSFDFDAIGLQFNGNIGVRYVQTINNATGKLTVQEYIPNVCSTNLSSYPSLDACIAANASGKWANRIKSVSFVTMEKEYDDWLPSFNLATWIKPNELAARFSFARVMARPKLTDLTPNLTCTIGSGSRNLGTGVSADEDDCSGGNPYLDPYRANQYDLSFEYYPNRDTQISLGLFYKDIESFILNATTQTVDILGDGTLYDVRMPINGRGAVTKGVEATFRTAFDFLPGWLSGFGTDLNYTYMQAEKVTLINVLDGSLLPYPGMSENSYNVTLWYDKGPLNARLAYNYRDNYYTGSNDLSGNPSFRKSTGYLDAKVSYDFNENTSFFIEGKNLTDQAEYSYSGLETLMTELAYPGKRYYMGVSLKF